MTDATTTAPRPPEGEPPPRRRTGVARVARAAAPVHPVWTTAFRDPVTDGHIRLEGLSWTERQAARVGLVTLGLLLLSVLFTDPWRRGTLLPVGDGESLTFVPEGLLAVTLFTFVVAWTMLLWGALTSSWPVRLLVAVSFLLTNASLSAPASIEVGDSAALRWGPDLVRGGFLASAGLVVLSIGLVWLPPRIASRVLPVLRLLVLLALTVFFMTHLWVHTAYVDAGFQGAVQFLVSNAISEIDGLLVPVVYVAAVLVIDFSFDVALGVSRSVRETPQRFLRWLLVALLAVKLWFVLFDELGAWATYAQDRPVAVVRTVVSVLVLALLVRWVSRLPATDVRDGAKERLLYGTSVALALPIVLSVMVAGAGVFTLVQIKSDEMPGFVDAYPSNAVDEYGLPAAAALAVVVGLWLVRRRRTPMDVELGSGLVVIGLWALPALLVNLTSWEVGWSDELVDVLVTLGVLAVVARCWNRIDLRLAVVLSALTVFAWLAMTKGDWINLVGEWFALPAILVVVVGVVFSLAGDAGFTAEGGRVVPQGARVLMFVGYLVLSVTILHWVEVTHAPSTADALGDAGFFFIGIPWAAWFIGRRLLHLHLEDPPPAVPSPTKGQ